MTDPRYDPVGERQIQQPGKFVLFAAELAVSW